MNVASPSRPKIPETCPFTIKKIQLNGVTDSKTYLIREHDQYGEFPHIYAKICRAPASTDNYIPHHYNSLRDLNGRNIESRRDKVHKVIVLSDTGCGTTVPNPSSSRPPLSPEDGFARPQPEAWNIRTFLEYTINPGGRIPYLVMTTHCHFDHIMGIGKLPFTSAIYLPEAAPTTILSSSHVKSFVSPYSNLQKHSLCDKLDLKAPTYAVGIWAEDMSSVVYKPVSSASQYSPDVSIPTPYTILHTPGHTPDSLSWYDADLRLLCVGDSFYAKESKITKQAKWGPEPPMPVIFCSDSDLKAWWESLEKVLKFVREKNAEVAGGNGAGLGSMGEPSTKLNVCAKELDRTCEAHDEDDGFVLIDADEARGEKEGVDTSPTSSKPSAALPPLRPPSSSKAQKQSGYDIPPPGQRGYYAMPTISTSSLLKPTIMPTQAIPFTNQLSDVLGRIQQKANLYNPDPWMLVLDRDKPLPSSPSQMPQALPEQPSNTKFVPPLSFHATKPEATARHLNRKPRVKLCAAHTTISIDAEHALTSMRHFMTRILKNEVPCKRVEDSPIGEECWLWDYDLDPNGSARVREQGHLRFSVSQHLDNAFMDELWEENVGYSVLAPLRLIEEGRRRIRLDELEGVTKGRGKRPAGVV